MSTAGEAQEVRAFRPRSPRRHPPGCAGRRLNGGEVDGAAGKPRPLEHSRGRAIAHSRAADAGRVAEHLVEGHHDEIGLPAVARSRRLVGTNAAASSSTSHPCDVRPPTIHSSGCCTPEKFDCAGNAKSRGPPSARPRQRCLHGRRIDAQVRRDRPARTSVSAPLRARKLPDAVHRVVIVERQQEPAARTEWIRLPYELQRA